MYWFQKQFVSTPTSMKGEIPLWNNGRNCQNQNQKLLKQSLTFILQKTLIIKQLYEKLLSSTHIPWTHTIFIFFQIPSFRTFKWKELKEGAPLMNICVIDLRKLK